VDIGFPDFRRDANLGAPRKHRRFRYARTTATATSHRRLVSCLTNIYALDGVNTKMLKSVTVQTEEACGPMARDIVHSFRQIHLENLR
jgi:hypothetical protein